MSARSRRTPAISALLQAYQGVLTTNHSATRRTGEMLRYIPCTIEPLGVLRLRKPVRFAPRLPPLRMTILGTCYPLLGTFRSAKYESLYPR
jgi:hypothetical protein